MANTLANLARMRSATTGTGSLALGAAVTGSLSFADAGLSNGSVVTYAIEDYDNNNLVSAREIGRGTFSGSTLSRDSVYASTNAGSKINCSGRQHVFITPAKEDLDTYLTTSAASSAFQPLDADLTTLAASITTFGHSLVDDADAATARTTLGLGTAATQATGTSGATLPFLNGSNTWSAQNIFTNTANLSNILAISTEGGASAGPFISVRRAGGSQAANDSIGVFNFQGQDSGGNNTNYGQLACEVIDPTDGSEDGIFRLITLVAGTLTFRMSISGGVWVGSPTGGDKGAGTLNATAVYDDSALLCAPVEFIKTGVVNTSTWDAFAIDTVEPEGVIEGVDEIEITLDEPEIDIVRERDGTFRKIERTTKKVPILEEHPVFDGKGQEVGKIQAPRQTRTIVPEKVTVRQNELAHEFKAMLDEGFDPRDPKAYFDKMLKDEALPGLKTKANWVPNAESNAKRTNRVILALELQAAVVKTLYERIEALEARGGNARISRIG